MRLSTHLPSNCEAKQHILCFCKNPYQGVKKELRRVLQSQVTICLLDKKDAEDKNLVILLQHKAVLITTKTILSRNTKENKIIFKS